MYPLEMHMVHVEDNFIGPKGLVNVGKAAAAKHGLAVLGIFFYIDNTNPKIKNHCRSLMIKFGKCTGQEHILRDPLE